MTIKEADREAKRRWGPDAGVRIRPAVAVAGLGTPRTYIVHGGRGWAFRGPVGQGASWEEAFRNAR